jgi:hypothetical protein
MARCFSFVYQIQSVPNADVEAEVEESTLNNTYVELRVHRHRMRVEARRFLTLRLNVSTIPQFSYVYDLKDWTPPGFLNLVQGQDDPLLMDDWPGLRVISCWRTGPHKPDGREYLPSGLSRAVLHR